MVNNLICKPLNVFARLLELFPSDKPVEVQKPKPFGYVPLCCIESAGESLLTSGLWRPQALHRVSEKEFRRHVKSKAEKERLQIDDAPALWNRFQEVIDSLP